MIASAYLAAEGFETPLAEELARRGLPIDRWHGRLALSPAPPVAVAWALDVWTAPRVIEVASVRTAATALRSMQRNWSHYAEGLHRRTALIAAALPPVKAAPLVFPAAAPTAHLGAWTLLAPDQLLASATKTSAFPGGECRFEADHIGPPSRAYLKLWEALTLLGAHPGPGQTCIDLGAAPGGWTFVLASLGARVLAVDKAPLDPRVAALPGVAWRQDSAFALAPEPCEWLVCDVIAYPDRLLSLAQRWIGAARRIICTIKFQGETDHAAAEAFAALPGGRVRHLFHNKHELTFFWEARPGLCPGPVTRKRAAHDGA